MTFSVRSIKSTKGFTLIELLVVIAIVGILAAVILASLKSARDKARLAKALSTMEEVNKAAYECLVENKALTVPARSTAGGTEICAGSQNLPSMTDTDFTYCGTPCGGWVGDGSNYYAISVYSDSYPGGRKVIICGAGYDASSWYSAILPSANFVGKGGCLRAGF